ncbi:FkbM family methyltransferase [Candidatus Pelagibacter bacterium]|nr:FkbM family methyltransferase [Candidatus Pelagibacter bacterium]MDA8844882.1 FkbM family methyltransferase [Candidatus Pelagibacter bacterium]
MLLIKFIKVTFIAFFKIPNQAKNYQGTYSINFIKLIIDQIIRTIGSLGHFFLKNRKYDDRLESIGNYRLLSEDISSNSIIYSCGIAKNIKFDKKISEKFNCDVYMFDPTKESYEFMNVNNNPKLKFYNIGVWTEDGDIKFYHPDDKYNNSEYGNLSATNFFKSGTYIKLPCKSIPSIMKEHKHLKIDVLKMDIEGAAFVILNHLLSNNVYPKQIIVELERPFFIYNASLTDFLDYFIKRRKIRKKLKQTGYDLIELKANELLAVKLY